MSSYSRGGGAAEEQEGQSGEQTGGQSGGANEVGVANQPVPGGMDDESRGGGESGGGESGGESGESSGG